MREHQARLMTRAEWGMLLTLSALWGSSFFFFKVLVAHWPPFTIVLGRVGLAAFVLNLALAFKRDPVTHRLPWGQLIVMGVLNNVIPFSLIVWGETRIPSGLASILNATTPVFAVVAAHFLTRSERLTWARAIGVLVGVCGVVVLVGPDAGRGLGQRSLLGEAACLVAALSYALAALYGRRFKGLPPLHVATGQLTCATVVILPIAAIAERFWTLPAPSVTVLGALGGIALLCTVLAYILYFRVLATAGATNLVLVTFLLPVSAVLLGRVVLGEAIGPSAIFGMALIGLGLAAIDGRVLSAMWSRLAAT